MVTLSELTPGRNVGVRPTDVQDLNVSALMDERSGFAAAVVGGLYGDVFIVDTLDEKGPTSVRAALMDPDPLWIVPIVAGPVNLTEEVIVGSNKTLDCRAAILNFDGKRLNASNASEVILCNFGVRYSDNDGITFRGSDMVWCHHLSLTSCGDGLLDISRAKEEAFTARHTVSWCKFTNHNKCSLVGLHLDSSGALYDHYIQATYHHCRMHCVQRMPRVSRCYVHAFNNVIYMDQEGMQSYDRGKILAERNLFRKTGLATACCDYDIAGYVNGRFRSVGNVFENGAANASSNPTGVADAPYPYTAQTMNSALRDKVLAEAGATLTL